jgi:hypothetical protein
VSATVPKGPCTPSVLFAGFACACKYVIQVYQKHTLSGMFVKLVFVNSYEMSCPHTNENLYDSTRFAQTKFSKITVSDQFLSAVMDVHTSLSLSNVFDIFAVWLNFGCVEILIIKKSSCLSIQNNVYKNIY